MSANITVYMVVNLTIRDKDEYRIYEKGFFSFLKKHNGTFLIRGGDQTEVEGEGLERTVLVEFPSYDVAYACYNSDEYQQALDFTKNSSTRFFSIVEGI